MFIFVTVVISISIGMVVGMVVGMGGVPMAEQMDGIFNHFEGPWHQKNAEHNRNR